MDTRRGVRLAWMPYLVGAALTAVTYWRLPVGSTYHFDLHGAQGAVHRVAMYVNFPVALAAVLVLLTVRRDRLAWVAVAMCAVAFVPAAQHTDDLSARWINVVPVLGVAWAVSRSLSADPVEDDTPRDGARWRWWVAGALALWSVPWLVASAGWYVDEVLGVDWIRASQASPDEPGLAAVHLGLHDGLFGAQLAVTALTLWFVRVPRGVRWYSSLMFVYGVLVAFKDGWNEQVVKRGWTGWMPPDVLVPALSWDWVVLLVLTAVIDRVRTAERRPELRAVAAGPPGNIAENRPSYGPPP